MTSYNLIVIGAGPAGLAAAIQARHEGLNVLLVERSRPGGRLLSARKVENFPLVGKSIRVSGSALSRAILAQAIRKGVKVQKGDCRGIDFGQGGFRVALEHTTMFAKAVVLATGVLPKEAKVLRGVNRRRWVYDWRALPARLSGKTVFVLGGGEVALDQACTLAERKARVTMLIRSRLPRSFPALVREAQALGVKVFSGVQLTSCSSLPRGLKVIISQKEEKRELWFDYGLISIGAVPQRPALSEEAKARIGRGLYFAGDVCNRRYRQAAIAFGDGVKKAMMAGDYLRRRAKE